MKSRYFCLARLSLAAGLMMASTSILARDLPVPGHYEVTTSTTYTDVPLPNTSVTTQNCLTAEDLERDPASVFAELPDGKNCDVDQFEMAAGKISMRVSCNAPDGDMLMVTSGEYDADGYQMVSDVTITVGEQKVVMQSLIEGKLLGDC